MRKFVLLLISLALFAPVLAQETNWEASPISEGSSNSVAVESNDLHQESRTPRSDHNISVEYGFLNFTDFIWALSTGIGSAFSHEEPEDAFFIGDISINYGYEVSDFFETGVIFNFAMPDNDIAFFTLMPRAKLNFNKYGFINPYMELDAGIIVATTGGAMPMLHYTLFGLEIGYFYIQLLGWGQRGLIYAGLKFPL
ncbi:hypothetical protein [Fibrobacter sp. UWEL]|uniref:hypothetical protein n=1 Tax=Fibrobacter sp. UWEL TaxID=1896209 RepID=UPI00091C2D76|nr:hypothetical protein [Fibrobacter sp. UWEL]SHL16185.1 hypothetical protein SAMN05720468_11541 [Fibrobacter sp. UWEL]